MPLISVSSYKGAPWWQFNGHLQTLVPGIFRKPPSTIYHRERIVTPDDDFLDLDWVRSDAQQLVVLTHGLEGNSGSQYVKGMAHLFHTQGWEVLAWNCRSCSGEMNRAFRMYHHGDTADIHTVLSHALRQKAYDRVVLVGFSMGGNITMKYLGTRGTEVFPEIKAAVAFSSPCDIAAGAVVLDHWYNFIYKYRFLSLLSKKIHKKALDFPGKLDVQKLKQIKQWRDFDEWFSAPLCGFDSADVFHRQASAKNFIEGIRVPTLLVSAKNDPILTESCFPIDIASQHQYFHLELPVQGGHCGFRSADDRVYAWSERRALEFVLGFE